MLLFSPLFQQVNDAMDSAVQAAANVRRAMQGLDTPHTQVARVQLDRPTMAPTPEFRAWMHRLADVAGELESEARMLRHDGNVRAAERRERIVAHLDRALAAAERVVAKRAA